MTQHPGIAAQLRRFHGLGGTDFVRKMINLFLQTSPPRVEAVRRAVEAGDLPAAEAAAHSLKSSAGNLGAVRVQELAGDIEHRAGAKQAERLAALTADLSDAMDQAISYLNQFLQSDAP